MWTLRRDATAAPTAHDGPGMPAPRPAFTLTAAFTLALAACGFTADDPSTDTSSPRDEAVLLSARAVEIGGFELLTVEPAPWQDTWRAPGRLTLDPVSTRPLGALVEGRIARVLVQVGDRVRAGQLLATLHSPGVLSASADLARARAALARAESELNLATGEAERAERLYEPKALSLAELERARAARTAAEAARAEAAAEAERAAALVAHLTGEEPGVIGDERVATVAAPAPGIGAAAALPHEAPVLAPIAGVVTARHVEPGAVVLVGSPLFTVSRLETLSLTLQLPEEALAAAKVGARVRFTAAAYPERSFEGTVQRVAPALDTLTRTIEVVARVENLDGALRPEMYVDAELLGTDGAPVLAVPADAVQLLDGETVVILGNRRGDGLRIEAVPVRTGRRTAGAVEIVAGLEAGQTVIVQGAATAKAEILRRRDQEG